MQGNSWQDGVNALLLKAKQLMHRLLLNYHNEHTHFCREMCNAVNTFWNIILMKITTQVCKSSIMGPHLGRILLKRSHFPHCKAFDLQVRKTLFRLRKHCIGHLLIDSDRH